MEKMYIITTIVSVKKFYVMVYLLAIIPRLPFSVNWKLEQIERVSRGSYRNHAVQVTAAIWFIQWPNKFFIILILYSPCNKNNEWWKLPVYHNSNIVVHELCEYWKDWISLLLPVHYKHIAGTNVRRKSEFLE